ncbi:iron chaperone [soil metagenome]
MESSKKAVSIDEYISWFKPEVREKLEAIRSLVHTAAPEAVEAIKYDMPTFVLNGNMVCFAAFSNHISIFPILSEMETKIAGLDAYKSGASTAKFPMNDPLPMGIIKQMIEFRVKEHRAKGK